MSGAHSHDVVIVGGGIAGSALATVLARNGLDVLVLERQTEFRDKVRGEVILPWGVAEMLRLDLEKPLLDAGGGYATHFVFYDEVFDPSEAEATALPVDQLFPGVPGCLDVGHPQACEALIHSAETAGATIIRGVGDIEIQPGAAPAVRYEHDDIIHETSCRLIVGADGRNSTVRRQLAIPLQHTTPRTQLGGLLVDDLHAWPAERATVGTEGDLHFFIFPRPRGRVRLYLLHDIAQKGRFVGPQGPAQFLKAYQQFRCIPNSDAFGSARPAGPCAFYPMNDSWTEIPYAPGAVLVGDAAGWSDPILGQGLSVSLRDVRILADVLRGTDDWAPDSFAEYAAERRERMRRMRITAHIATNLRATFTPEGAARRRAHTALLATDPVLGGAILSGVLGPEQALDEAFTQTTVDRIMALP